MGMDRQAVVDVLGNLMIVLARLILGVDMECHPREIAHVMQELMAHLLGDPMPLGHRQGWCHGDIDFRMDSMAQPARPHFGHRLDPGTCWAACLSSAIITGSTPSAARMHTIRPACQTSQKIAAVMRSPTRGSTIG